MSKSIAHTVLFCMLICSCTNNEGNLFKNPSGDETGIKFTNTLAENADQNILDYLYFYNGGGVAVGDVNNDGLPDIFFSGNQTENKLYLNEGNLKFKDISKDAGILGNSSWNTGAVMADINNDGLLDIYVCAVVGTNGFTGHNELFINQGDLTFTEESETFGLDFDSYSSNVAFLDFDLDGDLDIYILNHAVHTQESFGKAELRNKRNYQTGDKLMRNDGGKFVDVSEEAGIYGGPNGYGLGIAISDFNQDGFPDIFVGNDFHEDDYYYLNNGDGTFDEKLKEAFGHTSRFSMGNDVADINNDGWPDILSLDMLPEDEKILKSSEGAEDFQTQQTKIERFGYHYQFSRNMLFLNNNGKSYSETALLSGVAATDWSWSALFGDYDQDGQQDIFISNGINKRPNNLDFVNYTSNELVKKKIDNSTMVDKKALSLMPSGAIQNYVFKGRDNLTFENKSSQWITNDTIISGATAFGDFDLDGDLDLVTNNNNQNASLYINQTNENARYLKVRFKYRKLNPLGIGTKVFSYHNGIAQYKELYTVRGFQASSEPVLHFGYGEFEEVDSLKIVWPDHTYQVMTNIATNTALTISPSNTRPFDFESLQLKTRPIFKKIKGNLGIDFTHEEDSYIDFNRQKLIPYKISDRGPATAIGDLNDDGKDDIFFGGSRGISSKIYLQTDSAYVQRIIPEIVRDSLNEDVAAIITNVDGKTDRLIIGTGGGDFFDGMKPLLNKYYVINKDSIKSFTIPDNFGNVSVIAPHDFDGDGDIDYFIGNQAISNDFGKLPNSALLKNDNGRLIVDTANTFEGLGMATDAIWHDFDTDGIKDLIIVGEWMSPTFYKNDKGTLVKKNILPGKLNGLWQCIVPFDIDKDGDIDYIMGNWGTNTRFKASTSNPLKLYYGDFDENKKTESILAVKQNDKYYTLESLDELSKQLIYLKKKFPSYDSFAGKTITEVIGAEKLEKAVQLEVTTLKSGYLRNNGNDFSFVPFENTLQIAPILCMIEFDFNHDGYTEILAAGNYFGVKPLQGRFDSFSGALITSDLNIEAGYNLGLEFIGRSARHLNIVQLDGNDYLLVTMNNNRVQVYEFSNEIGPKVTFE